MSTWLRYIFLTSKLEISDQRKYVAARQCSFTISCKERQRAKSDREQAQMAANLRHPLLPSPDYNCAFQEERIWAKSWNTGQVGFLLLTNAYGAHLHNFYAFRLTSMWSFELNACWKPFSYPLQWAHIPSNHNCSDRSFCCSSTSKWRLCFHNMPCLQGSWRAHDTIVEHIFISKHLINLEYRILEVEILFKHLPIYFFTLFQHQAILAITPNIT